MRYKPPSLEKDIQDAVAIWAKALGVDSRKSTPLELVHEVSDALAGFLTADSNVDVSNVTKETIIDISLPRSDLGDITVGEFIQLAKLYQQGRLLGFRAFAAEKHFLFYVVPKNEDAHLWEYQGYPEKAAKPNDDETDTSGSQSRTPVMRQCFPSIGKQGDINIRCAFTRGLTPFALAISESGEWEKFLAPYQEEYERFVGVESSGPITVADAEAAAHAYLFELSASLGLHFAIERRPTPGDDIWGERPLAQLRRSRLRPLLLGRGLAEPMALHAQAIAADDSAVAILRYSQVVEYVAQTAVRLESNESIRKVLLSARALSPDADYIESLQTLVRDQQRLYKDAESVRFTIRRCCDIAELIPRAPPFLVELVSVGKSKSAGKTESKRKLAFSTQSAES